MINIMLMVMINDDDPRQNDNSTNAPQIPPIRPSTQILLLSPIKSCGPSLSLFTQQFIQQYKVTIQSDNFYYSTIQSDKIMIFRLRLTQQGPGRAQTWLVANRRARRDLKTTNDHSHLRPSLPFTTPPHHSVTKMYIFKYIRIFFDSSIHSYFIRFKL